MANKAEQKPQLTVEPVTEQKTSWVRILLIIAVILLGGWLLWLVLGNTASAQAKPEPACKVENAECKTNDSNKLCCEGLVCMDKGVPSENGKCALVPTPTPTLTPTPTPTPTIPACPTWTCGECQEMGEEKETLVAKPVCENEDKYCKETYGCDWVCPTEDKCKKDEKVWSCECPPEPTPTPTPEVTPTPTDAPKASTQSAPPSGCTENCGVPACTDTTPQPVTNPHIYRNGDCAIVKYWPSSDKVNIYWRLNSSSGWEHSLANQPATGNHDICGLNNYDYTFGVQSVSGCAADGIVNASNISEIVDGVSDTWVLFR
jgi:hypothetical protein